MMETATERAFEEAVSQFRLALAPSTLPHCFLLTLQMLSSSLSNFSKPLNWRDLNGEKLCSGG